MDLTDSSVYDGGIPAKGPSMNSKPLPKIQSFLKELKRNQPAGKKQTLQEWSMAGGGVPTQYKGREHVWHAKVNKFAAGGEVHMGAGGVIKGLIGKGMQKVLPAAERDANLAKMLEDSKVKERLYHGTKAHDDYAEEAGQAFGQFTGKPTWLAKEPYTASGYSAGTGSTYPVHAQVKKPLALRFDANDAAKKAFPVAKRFGVDIDHMVRTRKPERAWEVINDPAFIDAVEAAGHDGLLIAEDGYKTYGVFDPRKIKSATGNRGTYDISDPDISKAAGGEVKMAGGGDPLDEFSPPRYRSAGRRPENQNDRRAAANMPMDFARGVVSGIGGAPGDIESLIRMLPGLNEKTVLPTSEDIEKRLPFKSDTPAGRAASGLGTLAGGLYMGPGAPIRLVGGVPQAVYKAGKDFGRAAGQPATRLDVYHGSPHKFDRFDASKIGTGEGNQSYGYGLYLAENPEVAKFYQKMVNIGPLSKQAKKFVRENIIAGADNDAISKAATSSKNQATRWDLEDVKRGIPASRNDYVSAMDEVQEFLRKNPIAPNDGSLYKVDLPDEQIAKMLDWDKPMTESEMTLLYDKMQQSPLASFAKPFQDNFYSAMERGHKTPDGQDLFMELSKQLGGQKYVSEALRELGIPGIKYLDNTSRGAGTGTRNFVTFPGEEQSMTILERNGQPMVAPAPEGMAHGGAVHMAGGGAAKTVVEGAFKGVKKLLGMADEVPKGVEPIVVKPKAAKEPVPLNYSQKVLDSTAARFAEKIAAANPKLSNAEVAKKAMTQATKKLEWERTQKPALEKQYGALAKSSYAESNPVKQQNTPEVVQERMRKANEFLDIPTEAWTPPKPELQAFDRSSIRDALEGFPGVEQSKFPRDIPSRANIEHVEGLYTDPANRALIEKQIKRGLPLGGESFYASLYPVKQAVLEAGMPAEKFDQWIHSLAPASARNSIMNEMAVGQFMRDMNARGIPLTEENVAREMAVYKEKFGIGLPLMPLHRQGVANVIEGGLNLRDMSLANIPTNYKIPTYGSQKAGDFANSVVLDVHEAGGQTQGSRFHPYFNEQGGFGNTEYNAGEQGMLGIAKDLGIPGGMAQAGRWFGGGELTGLKSPRGDALDLLEKQVAYTLQQKGVQPNPANVRAEVLRQIETGEGDLLPWYRKEGMPDVRQTGLQRAEGGEVNLDEGNLKKHKPSNIMFGKTPAQQHKRGGLSSIK